MTLSELIKHVGDENVVYQRLDHSMTNISTNKKGESTITFKTNQLTANAVGVGIARMHGLVIWLPTDKLPKL